MSTSMLIIPTEVWYTTDSTVDNKWQKYRELQYRAVTLASDRSPGRD